MSANKKQDKPQKKQRRKPKNAKQLPRKYKNASPKLKITPQSLESSAMVRVIQNEQVLDPVSVQNMFLGYFSLVVTKGYMNAGAQPQDLYFAYIRIQEVYVSAIQSGTALSTRLPRWLILWIHAARQKSVRIGLGAASYRFRYTQQVPNSSTIPTTAAGDEIFNFYVPSNSPMINMFPVAAPPPGYTDENGQSALSSVFNFMATEKKKLHEVVEWFGDSVLSRDVSAFSYFEPKAGQGGSIGGQAGGWAGATFLEVPIAHPLFTKFNTSNPQSYQRHGRFLLQTTGDLCSNVFHTVMTIPENQWNTKIPIQYSFVDFNEISHVLALTISKGLTQAYNNPAGSTVEIPPCPLSLQEMQLILRNDLMYAFSQSQPGNQTIIQTAPSENFVPLVASVTTAPVTSVCMKLPMPLVENMRCLQQTVVEVGRTKQPLVLSPILGIWKGETLTQSEYEYTKQTLVAGEVVTSVEKTFTIPVWKRPKLKKQASKSKIGVEEKQWEQLVETPIDLIDGRAAGTFVFINDTKHLQELAALWNEWLVKLTASLSSLSTLSTTQGSPLMCALTLTRAWETVSNFQMKMDDTEDERLTRFRVHVENPYTLKVTAGYSSMAPKSDEAFSILRQWILPQVKLAVSGVIYQNITFQKLQAIYCQPFYWSQSSTGKDAATVAAINEAFASGMTKAQAAELSEFEIILKKWTENGNGGMLSSLAAGLARTVLGDKAGNVADAIAGVLPI